MRETDMQVIGSFEINEHVHTDASGLFEISCTSAGCPGPATEPEMHDACGHFHWDHQGGCPESPCGSLLCCIN